MQPFLASIPKRKSSLLGELCRADVHMKYEVRCECGKVHEVSAADAGGSLKCACERTVDVPALHVLRAAVGQVMLSPAFQLEGLLLEGKLPGTRDCAKCRRETDRLIQVSVVCERGTSKADGGSADRVAEEGLGCLLGFLGLPSWWTHGLREGHTPTKNRGQDIAFIVPLPVCEACRSMSANPAALRLAFRSVPTYRALLDQYPKARVTSTN